MSKSDTVCIHNDMYIVASNVLVQYLNTVWVFIVVLLISLSLVIVGNQYTMYIYHMYQITPDTGSIHCNNRLYILYI